MSHTYKDLPDWVEANNRGMVKHDHATIGKPLFIRQRALDESGRKVIKKCERIITYAIEFVDENGTVWITSKPEEVYFGLFHLGIKSSRTLQKVQTFYTYLLDNYFIGHQAHCNGEIARYRGGLSTYSHTCRNAVRCYYVPPQPRLYWNRPQQWARKDYHRQARAQERNALTRYKKLMNSMDAEDWDEIEMLEVESRSKNHTFRW